jgi:hypothetical protein
MKRFFVSAIVQLLVFGLLGASIWSGAGLALFAFEFWHSEFTLETSREIAGLFTAVFPFAVVYGCAIALFDLVLASVKVPYRVIASALVAMGTMAWMLADLTSPAKIASVGLLGALPAALCSWLCMKIAARTPASLLPSDPQPTAASPG